MRGSVCEGNPAAMALTVELADAEAEALPEAVEETEGELVDDDDGALVAVLVAGPADGLLQAAIARAAPASIVAAMSRRAGRVMRAIGMGVPSVVWW
ncbi:hypothetical protein [Sinomonas cyclohexanicum]|nr:hypothetical protein [Corynebacterium cyclohexanicum]